MKKSMNTENNQIKSKDKKNKKHKRYDRGQIFVKIMAGILALMMIMSVAGSLIYYLVK